MASFQYFDQFVEDLCKKVHNLSADTLKVALCNTAPVAANAVYANLTPITAEHGYDAGGTQATITSCEQTAGTVKLILADVVFTASGGTIGPARYAVLYNDTPESPAKPLIGFWDRGSSVTLLAGESLTIDFSAANGVLTIAPTA